MPDTPKLRLRPLLSFGFTKPKQKAMSMLSPSNSANSSIRDLATEATSNTGFLRTPKQTSFSDGSIFHKKGYLVKPIYKKAP